MTELLASILAPIVVLGDPYRHLLDNGILGHRGVGHCEMAARGEAVSTTTSRKELTWPKSESLRAVGVLLRPH